MLLWSSMGIGYTKQTSERALLKDNNKNGALFCITQQ